MAKNYKVAGLTVVTLVWAAAWMVVFFQPVTKMPTTGSEIDVYQLTLNAPGLKAQSFDAI